MAKAYVGTACLEQTGCDLPGVVEDGMSGRKDSESVETTRRSPRRSVHSEGIWYKPQSGEIGMCLRVGRMGPVKRRWTGTEEPGPERGPLGQSGRVAQTEVHQRAPSPGTERGSDEGSGEHEGRWQTDRREDCASHGKALSDTPALKPYWGKPAVRNFRESNGNGGILRSPLRAIALPDQSCEIHVPDNCRR